MGNLESVVHNAGPHAGPPGEPVDLGKWVDESDDVRLIAIVDQSPSAMALLKVLKKKLDTQDEKVHTRPQRDDKNLKNDLVYILGELGLGEWIESLIYACRKRVKEAH